MSATLSLLYRGNIVHCLENKSLQLLEDYLLAVDKDGIICKLVPFDGNEHFFEEAFNSSSENSIKLIRPVDSHSFLLPSFIDTHLHAPQYLYAGTALDVPLMEWLEKYTFRSESRIDLDPNGLGKKVYSRLAKRCIENGTTCAALYGTISVEANLVLAECFKDAGIRALVGKVNMDQNSPEYVPRLSPQRASHDIGLCINHSYYTESTKQSLEETKRFIERMKALYSHESARHKHLVEPIITPRFLPTCSKDLLKGLADIAQQQDVDNQSHLSESGDEVAFTQSIYGKKTDSELFDEVGLLGPKSLFAHSTHITAEDMSLLKSKGSSVAHCPLSNTYFSERPFPLREALDNDLKVGLGSDIAGGYSLGLNESMRWSVGVSRIREGRRKDNGEDAFCKSRQEQKDTASLGQKSSDRLDINWKEAIYVATLGSARAINRDTYLGNFEVGKSFDAQLIELSNDGEDDSGIDLFAESFPTGSMGLEEVLEKWWSLCTVKDRKGVWVAGKRLR